MQQPEGLWTMNAKQEALLKLRCYISERVLVFENKLMSRIGCHIMICSVVMAGAGAFKFKCGAPIA